MYKEISANKRKTVIIMAGFLLLVGGLAALLGWSLDSPGMTYGVLIGGFCYLLFSYFVSSSVALAVNGAKPIAKSDSPRLYRIVENLAITEGLPMPKVYIIDDPALNAFATGRDPSRASISVTTGLLAALEDTELEGVVAHELGHIKNYDIRVALVAFALVAVIGLIADIMVRAVMFGGDDDDAPGGQLALPLMIVAAILAPIAATLIQLAISRRREYLADATGALTTRYPEGLARALEKISQYGSATKRQNTSTAHLFFANPLKGKGVSGLFSTHPPIADRIQKLRSMGTHD